MTPEQKTLTNRYKPGAVRSALYVDLAIPGRTISDAIHDLSIDLFGDDSRASRQRIYKWLTGDAPTPAWARDKCLLIALPRVLALHGLYDAHDVLSTDKKVQRVIDDIM